MKSQGGLSRVLASRGLSGDDLGNERPINLTQDQPHNPYGAWWRIMARHGRSFSPCRDTS